MWYIDLILKLWLSIATSTGSASVPAHDPAAQIVFDGGEAWLGIQAEDLVGAQVEMHADGPYLLFRLNEVDSAALADLTGARIGQVLTVSICGQVLVEPIVRERISGAGVVRVDDLALAFALADALNGRGPCPAPE